MEVALGAEGETIRLFMLLGRILSFSEAEIYLLIAVFTRVGAVIALLPGFGAQMVPTRVRLGATIAFTALVWPLVSPGLSPAEAPGGLGPIGGSAAAPFALGRLLMAEAAAGLTLGLAIRLTVMSLQFAASIAAQATSVLQIFGSGVTPDPMPAIGNLLTIAGIALAMSMGLHIKAILAIVGSYDVLPFGVFPVAGDFASWGVARASAAFALALSLAAPFLIAGLVYNIAIGAINRAMPQLMVAFVGAPAITGGALFLLFLAGPVMLLHWAEMLDQTLGNPFGVP